MSYNLQKSNQFGSKRGALFRAMVLSAIIPLSGCATVVEEAQKRGISAGGFGTGVGVLTGAGTTIGCRALVKDNGGTIAGVSKRDAGCALLGIGVGLGAKFASQRIFKNMSEKDQRVAIAAATKSLDTGETITVELPESGETFTAAASGDTKSKTKTESIFADTIKVPRLSEKYASVGDTYSAPKTVNVRSGPSRQFDVADSLSAGSKVHVFGEPEGTGWLLVGKTFDQAEDWGTLQVPVAVGYVRSDLLRALDTETAADAQLASVQGKQKTNAMREVKTSWDISCQTMSFERKGKDGKIVQDKSELCYGPLGAGA